jgi:BirA family biotin operon repressor/biotin-[acetyl-CoA-carboxylase] ligase
MATHLETAHFEEVGSTQVEALRLFAGAHGSPLLVIADRQTDGTGRMARSWITAPRALACSLVTVPAWDPSRWGTIPLVAGLAARSALRAYFSLEVSLKWPNDLIMPSGKVGGLIAEASGSQVVIGFGANLWWPEPPAGMAALHDIDPGGDAATAIAHSWADEVLTVLAGPPSEWGHADYRAACLTLSTFIEWEPDGSGEAVDVVEDGGLVVRTDTGRRILYSGEVHTVRPTILETQPADGNRGI